MTIVSYTPDLQERLVALLRLNTPAAFAPEEEADFVEFLQQHREQYFVLLLDNEVIGCGGFNLVEGDTHARISWDLLHPAHQGKGYGTILLQHRLRLIHLIPAVQRISVRTSQIAWRFYEKNGFVLHEVAKDFWANGIDLYRMEWGRAPKIPG